MARRRTASVAVGDAVERRGARVWTIALVGLVAVVGVASGFEGFAGRTTDPVGGLGAGATLTPDGPGSMLVQIVARNIPLAMLMFAGVVTLGLTTLVSTAVLSLYVGATLGAASGNVGLASALWSIAAYAPLEFAGFLVASYAGLRPVVGAVRRSVVHEAGALAAYLDAARGAVTTLAVGLALLLAGAAVEALVIQGRMP